MLSVLKWPDAGRRIARLVALPLIALLALLPAILQARSADGAGETAVGSVSALGPSGLPLPRFVSLRSGRVNSRIGPGIGYPVDWLYLKPGLPMEIIQEYDNWRRVRDADGAEGWINQALLSGKRTAIAAPWQRGKDVRISLLTEGRESAAPVAFVEPGAVGTIVACDGEWCEMRFADAEGSDHQGFVAQTQVWGAYPGEFIED